MVHCPGYQGSWDWGQGTEGCGGKRDRWTCHWRSQHGNVSAHSSDRRRFNGGARYPREGEWHSGFYRNARMCRICDARWFCRSWTTGNQTFTCYIITHNFIVQIDQAKYIHIHIHIYRYIQVRIHISLHEYACMYTLICRYMYIHVYTFMYTWEHIYIHIYIYI